MKPLNYCLCFSVLLVNCIFYSVNAQVTKDVLVYRRGSHFDLYNFKTGRFVTNKYYTDISKLSDTLFRVTDGRNGGKGLVTSTGREILPCQYRSINSKFIVRDTKRHEGLFDPKKEKWLIPLKDQDIDDVEIGGGKVAYLVSFDKGKKTISGLWMDGKWLLPQKNYELSHIDSIYFIATNYVSEKEQTEGVIDINGKIIVPFEFETLNSAGNVRNFTLMGMKQGKYDIFSLNYPRQFTEPRFTGGYKAMNYTAGLFGMRTGDNYQAVDYNGKLLSDLKFEELYLNIPGSFLGKLSENFSFYNYKGEVLSDLKFVEAGNYSEGRLPVSNGSLWGYADSVGKLVVPFKYKRVQSYYKGIAFVTEKSGSYYINKAGERVYDVADKVGLRKRLYLPSLKANVDVEFSNADNSVYCVVKDDNYGLIKADGSILVPFIYPEKDFYFEFSPEENFVIVSRGYNSQFLESTQSADGLTLHGIYDLKGQAYFNSPVDLSKPHPEKFYYAECDEVTSVEFLVDSNFTELTDLIENEEEEEHFFLGGGNQFAKTHRTYLDDEQEGIINTIYGDKLNVIGKYISRSYLANGLKNPMYPIYFHSVNDSIALYNFKNLYGYYYVKGDSLGAAKFAYAETFRNGRAVVCENGKCGILASSGKYLVAPAWNSVLYTGAPNEYVVVMNKKYGVINAAGQVIIPAEYEGILSSEAPSEIYVCQKNKKFGVVDNAGKVLVDFKFDDAHHIADGLIMVKEKNLYGYIDVKGNWVIPPTFERANCFDEGRAAVKKNGEWILIDKAAREIRKLPREVEEFGCFYEKVVIVFTKTGFGAYNKNWELLVPPIYSSVEYLEDLGVFKVMSGKKLSGYYTADGLRLFDYLRDR
jgi:hypothetical protein